jgi:hypothetical protein
MVTVRYFTTMNQPQQVGRTDKKQWHRLCIVYLLLCNDVVACWEHAASNDIDTVKLAGEERNKGELRQFAAFHWSDSGKPRQTSVRTAGFTEPTSNKVALPHSSQKHRLRRAKESYRKIRIASERSSRHDYCPGEAETLKGLSA